MTKAAPHRWASVSTAGYRYLIYMCFLWTSPTLNAQAASTVDALPQLPAFDVVSIKPHVPSDRMIRIRSLADGISASGMPMHMILREALGVTNDRLLGEPDWVNLQRYDVEAKVTAEDAPKLKQFNGVQRWSMLLPALEDRCALKFHHETKEMTVYALEVAKGGIKMQLSGTEDATPLPPPGQMKGSGNDAEMTLVGREASISSIVRMLSMQIGSTVIDKTGLTGKYNYTFAFMPDENVVADLTPLGGDGGASPPEAQGPSIFTALQEQLGLKLVAQKEPEDVIVIDHVVQPKAN